MSTGFPYYPGTRAVVYNDKCLTVLKTLPDASVDAVVTDPPYGLSREPDMAEVMKHWLAGDDYTHTGNGFMGKSWDSFVPGPSVWRECFRVLKPGGHLLSFAGSRTQDLMGLSLRLAGFEIRDSIAWLYGSGFPKSLDVSKAIDKARDDKPESRQVGAWLRGQREAAGLTHAQVCAQGGWHGATNHGGASVNWEKGHSVPTWDQWLTLRDLLGFDGEMDAEVWRLNGRKGTPGNDRPDREVSGPAGNVVYQPSQRVMNAGTPVLEAAQQWQGWGTALKPAFEPIVVGRKPLTGTVAGNVQEHGTGALNIDACMVAHGADVDLSSEQRQQSDTAGFSSGGMKAGHIQPKYDSAGRWPTNVVLDDSQAAELDSQTGVLTSGNRAAGTYGLMGYMGSDALPMPAVNGDSGGASRFFPTFKYQAKAPAKERPKVDGVSHPTVKPLELMRWLVRLVTPPDGVVLDPFAGSGTTVEAALLEGFHAVGVEYEAEYLPLIFQRIQRATPGLNEATA
jgi:DNA modification methylase